MEKEDVKFVLSFVGIVAVLFLFIALGIHSQHAHQEKCFADTHDNRCYFSGDLQ